MTDEEIALRLEFEHARLRDRIRRMDKAIQLESPLRLRHYFKTPGRFTISLMS